MIKILKASAGSGKTFSLAKNISAFCSEAVTLTLTATSWQ